MLLIKDQNGCMSYVIKIQTPIELLSSAECIGSLTGPLLTSR